LIDLNYLLLFIAVASALILWARIIRLRNPRNRGWRLAAMIVLLSCAAAWLVVPRIAGYVGGILWALLLVLPSVAEHWIEGALLGQHFARARWLAIVRQIFHPWNDSPYRAALLSLLELAARGRLDLALDRLAVERQADTPAGRYASALTFALTENWSGLKQWGRSEPRVLSNPAVYGLYLRSLGETGARDSLIYEVGARSEAAPIHLALVLAFSGKTSLLVRLFSGRLRKVARERQEFWIATAELAMGRDETGRERLTRLRGKTIDAVLRRSIDRRLATSSPTTPPSPSTEALLERLLVSSEKDREFGGRGTVASAPVVWALIIANLVMFGVELLLGGGTNGSTLHLLGALESETVLVRHEYWRLLTSPFLHYGALHLGVNLLALYLLGPELERLVGGFKFLLGYLATGVGAGIWVLTLRWLNWTKPNELVGASGCIMGVIGILAGLLFRDRESPRAGQRLRMILMMVALETIYDLSTPQVSLAAHLGGFATGVALGLILSRQRTSPSRVPDQLIPKQANSGGGPPP
jgi:rhomboid protease GluP